MHSFNAAALLIPVSAPQLRAWFARLARRSSGSAFVIAGSLLFALVQRIGEVGNHWLTVFIGILRAAWSDVSTRRSRIAQVPVPGRSLALAFSLAPACFLRGAISAATSSTRQESVVQQLTSDTTDHPVIRERAFSGERSGWLSRSGLLPALHGFDHGRTFRPR